MQLSVFIIQPTKLPARIDFKELRHLPSDDKIQSAKLQSHLLHKNPYLALKHFAGIPLFPPIQLCTLCDSPIGQIFSLRSKLIAMDFTVYV